MHRYGTPKKPRKPSAKKVRMYESIAKHGQNLAHLFGLHGADPVKLSKSVLRLENKAHRLAEDYSSRPLPEGYVEKQEAAILRSLDKLLHFKKHGVPVFFNMDPRGYALKIDDEYMKSHNVNLHRDFGGYGILAPDFRD
jgi:hypothetical protein